MQQEWNDWDKLEQRWSKTQKRQLEEGLQAARWRRSARAEWEPTACRRSSSRGERGAACSGWDSRTWCVLGSRNEGPSRDWAWWRLDGWGPGRPRRKEGEWGEGPSLAITAMFCLDFAYVFRLSVSMRRLLANIPSVYSYTWILIYFTFISFYSFSCKTKSNIWFYMLDVIICRHTWSCQICTHIQTKIHTHKNMYKRYGEKQKERGKKQKERGEKKWRGGQGRKKEKERKRTKRKRELKKRGKREKRRGEKKGKKRKREGDGFRGVEERGY